MPETQNAQTWKTYEIDVVVVRRRSVIDDMTKCVVPCSVDRAALIALCST